MTRKDVATLQNDVWNALSPYIEQTPLNDDQWRDVVAKVNEIYKRHNTEPQKTVIIKFSSYLMDVLKANGESEQ